MVILEEFRAIVMVEEFRVIWTMVMVELGVYGRGIVQSNIAMV